MTVVARASADRRLRAGDGAAPSAGVRAPLDHRLYVPPCWVINNACMLICVVVFDRRRSLATHRTCDSPLQEDPTDHRARRIDSMRDATTTT